MPVLAGISARGLLSATSAGITSTPAARITTTTAVAAAMASSSRPHRHSVLLGLNSDIPTAVQGKRINRNNAVLIRELVELGQALHIVCVLIEAMEQDHDRVMPLRIVPL